MFLRKLSLLLIIFSTVLTGQIKSPGNFFGHELGDRFNRHHQIVDYFQHLKENSSQIQLVPYGKTIEGRLLQLVFISQGYFKIYH